MFGLGWPQWLLIIGLIGGLLLTFRVMAKASVAYARARERREALGLAAETEREALERRALLEGDDEDEARHTS